MKNPLVKLEGAKRSLEQAKSLTDVKKIMDSAEAFKAYARAAKMGIEMQNDCAEIKVRAERKSGELIKLNPDLQWGGGLKKVRSNTTTLKDLGITKDESSKWQQMADVSEGKFEKHIKETKEKKQELTSASLLQIAKSEKRDKQQMEMAEKGKSIKLTKDDIDLRFGDFRKVLKDIESNSIDLILTDPPYPSEYLPLWSDLGKLASRVLKKNGFLVCYSGILNFNHTMKILNVWLDYYWTFALVHSGNKQLIFPRNVFCGWKPIMVFQKEFKKLLTKTDDIIQGTGREKEYHGWQQAEVELVNLIKTFSNPGDTILEPFAGSGTTIIASHKLKRKVIACEIEKTDYNKTKGRINDEL